MPSSWHGNGERYFTGLMVVSYHLNTIYETKAAYFLDCYTQNCNEENETEMRK